jgi:hypothetical protein
MALQLDKRLTMSWSGLLRHGKPRRRSRLETPVKARFETMKDCGRYVRVGDKGRVSRIFREQNKAPRGKSKKADNE